MRIQPCAPMDWHSDNSTWQRELSSLVVPGFEKGENGPINEDQDQDQDQEEGDGPVEIQPRRVAPAFIDISSFSSVREIMSISDEPYMTL